MSISKCLCDFVLYVFSASDDFTRCACATVLSVGLFFVGRINVLIFDDLRKCTETIRNDERFVIANKVNQQLLVNVYFPCVQVQ